MDSQILSDDIKTRCCKITPSRIMSEWLLSIQSKCFIESIKDIFSYPRLEIMCELPQSENSDIHLIFSPNQRKSIVVNLPYLKDTTTFTWYFISNQQIDAKSILNSIIISFRCLEN